MLKVYNLMAIGLAITGLAAYFAFTFAVSDGQLTAFGAAIYTSPLKWVVIFAPLALVFLQSIRINSMSVSAAQTTFAVYAALVGLSLSSIFLIYTGQSVVQTFFVTAASFGALSLYGYTTKRDLTQIGSFLIMGLFGLIIASIVNVIWPSGPLGFAISILGVVIFLGLTAWDTQKIKESYQQGMDAAWETKGAVMGALSLYLDFLNLFLMLLRLFGQQRN
jgi:FtsH-binding integral membrane protein